MSRVKNVLSVLLPVSILSLSFAFAKDSPKSQNLDNSEKSFVTVSSTTPDLNEEGLVDNSNIIVKGKVVGMSKPFEIQPADGGASSIFTDYYFQPTEFIAGSELVSNKNKLPIRIEGGDLNNKVVTNENNPNLTVGETYTLFLMKPDIGGGFNTRGEYFYITGSEQGVAKEANNSNIVSTKGSKSLKLNKNNLKAKKNIIKEHSMKNTFLEGLQENLETGFITQEEYNQAISSSQNYADIK